MPKVLGEAVTNSGISPISGHGCKENTLLSSDSSSVIRYSTQRQKPVRGVFVGLNTALGQNMGVPRYWARLAYVFLCVLAFSTCGLAPPPNFRKHPQKRACWAFSQPCCRFVTPPWLKMSKPRNREGRSASFAFSCNGECLHRAP